jgi:Fur family ferric uptake transcriptional regulator
MADPASGGGTGAGGARRVTRQRAAIAALLDGAAVFTTAQDLHARLRSSGEGIGLATVYRTLATMVADGELDCLRTGDGETAYRHCSTGHHHHLVCRVCGRTVEVSGLAVESWAERVSSEHGFRDVAHTLEIVGRCPRC